MEQNIPKFPPFKQLLPDKKQTVNDYATMLDDDDLIDQFLADQSAQEELDRQIREREEKLKRRPKIDPQVQGSWVYPYDPTRERRKYQYDISRQALFKNTLVCLPTGLGKTMIASVVMYNMYRWFSTGKILFVAPTVSLVVQQCRACCNTIDFKESDVVTITGVVKSSKRVELWKQKRIFFCTAPCVVNDMRDGLIPTDDIVLVVVDEAHRATGDHDYCKLVRMLYEKTPFFRVLALTATPGKDLPTIQKVITNLHINHIEVRSESDLKQYTHDKSIIVEQCPLTEPIIELESMFVRLVSSLIDMLHNFRAYFERDPRRVTHQALRQAMVSFIGSGRGRGNYMATSVFTLAISLYHAYSDLLTQGIHNFIKSLEKIELENQTANKKNKLRNSIFGQPLFHDMKRRAKDLLEKHKHEHPKIVRLVQIVQDHFRQKEVLRQKTRVIIFANKKQTVRYITQVLSNMQGSQIKAMEFLGQNKAGQVSGLTSKEQKEVIEKFSQGKYNTLVSTSVGEEGLDIGEVDMIICFDAVSSPTRMIQRMGRTGRKRDGIAVMILSEGIEAETYRRAVEKTDTLFDQMKKLPTSKGVRFFDGALRMIPFGIEPNCIEMDLRPKQAKVGSSTSRVSSPKKARTRKQPMITTTELKYLYNKYGGDNYVVPGRYYQHLSSSFGTCATKLTPCHNIPHSNLLKSMVTASRLRTDPTYDWRFHRIESTYTTPCTIQLDMSEIENQAEEELRQEAVPDMNLSFGRTSFGGKGDDDDWQVDEIEKERLLDYLHDMDHQTEQQEEEKGTTSYSGIDPEVEVEDDKEEWGRNDPLISDDDVPNRPVVQEHVQSTNTIYNKVTENHDSSSNNRTTTGIEFELDDMDIGDLLDFTSQTTTTTSSAPPSQSNQLKRSRAGEEQDDISLLYKRKRYL